jgi:hypothetical protein
VLKSIFWFTVFVLIVGGFLVWSLLRRSLFARKIGRVLKDYVRDRDEIQAAFLQAAGASGKPRGLLWKKCEFQDGLVLARDRATGEIVGLVPATIRFEAVRGGDMEDVEAVGNLRAATAVLTWKRGAWTTQGRTVFNLEPREVLERYRENLDAL